MSTLEGLLDALHAFLDTIEATGGCGVDDGGFVVPQADPDWIDLGAAYVKACGALGREPMVGRDGAEGEDDEGDDKCQ